MKTFLAALVAGSSFLVAAPVLADDSAPPFGAVPETETPRPLGAALVSGIAIGSTGVTAAAVGSLLIATLPSWEGCPMLEGNQTCDDFEPSNVTAQRTTGIALMIGGAALLGAAVPLMVVGANNRGSDAARTGPASAKLSVGPGHARLRFQF